MLAQNALIFGLLLKMTVGKGHICKYIFLEGCCPFLSLLRWHHPCPGTVTSMRAPLCEFTYLIGVWPDQKGSRHTNGPCIALRLERW